MMLRTKTVLLLVLTGCVCAFSGPSNGVAQKVESKNAKAAESLAFEVKSLGGKKVNLAEKYQDKVVMIVNVASECGLTPQYEQLQELHEKYAKEGLAVLGFPCNQFGKQEPGSSDEIQEFCSTNYGVKFDMFEKVEVNGKHASDLYKHLTKLETKPKGAGKVSWNFEKFLIDRGGNVIARFKPQTEPNDPEVIAMIEASLK
jgi:glutathione peroxidase